MILPSGKEIKGESENQYIMMQDMFPEISEVANTINGYKRILKILDNDFKSKNKHSEETDKCLIEKPLSLEIEKFNKLINRFNLKVTYLLDNGFNENEIFKLEEFNDLNEE